MPARRLVFQMAEVIDTRDVFEVLLQRIEGLFPTPV
jgi:hypothetical protein